MQLGIVLDEAEPRIDDISKGKMVPLSFQLILGPELSNNYLLIHVGDIRNISDSRIGDRAPASIVI